MTFTSIRIIYQYSCIILIGLILPSSEIISQSLPVGTTSITFVDPDRNDRNIACDVYYPATANGTDTGWADGSFGHVVFGHGFLMAVSSYQTIATALASSGFVVLLPTTEGGLLPSHENFGRDLAFVAEDVIAKSVDEDDFFFEKITGSFAIGGHSMGGGATYLSHQFLTEPANCYFTFAAAETNPSSTAAVSGITAPNLFFAGELDCVTPPDVQQSMYNSQTDAACKYYIEILGGFHCQFNDPSFTCNLGENSCSPGGGISLNDQVDIVLSFLIPWLSSWLDNGCEDWDDFTTLALSSQDIDLTYSCDIEPLPGPIINTIGQIPACPGETVTLIAEGIGDLIPIWSNGEVGTEISVSESGEYFFTINNGVCVVASSIIEVVFQEPIMPFVESSSGTSLCPGEVVVLQALPGEGQISWSTGSVGASIEVTEPGIYTFTEEVDGCVYESTPFILNQVVDPGAMVQAPNGLTICGEGNIILMADGLYNDMVWSDGQQGNQITASVSGNYFFEYSFDGCVFSSTNSVDVSQIDNVPASVQSEDGKNLICPGESLNLFTDAEGEIFWIDGQYGPNITISEGGAYSFELFIHGCTFNSDTLEIFEADDLIPVVVSNGPNVLCPGDSLSLSASEEGVVEWSNGETTTSIQVASSGTYSYMLTAQGCTYLSDTTNVIVESDPGLKVEVSGGGLTLCEGDSLMLATSFTGGPAMWSDSTVSESIVIADQGVYFYTVELENCSFQSDTVEILMVPKMDAKVDVSSVLPGCKGDTIRLVADVVIDDILWNTGDSSDLIEVVQSGMYFYSYFVDGCSFDSDSVNVAFIEPPQVDILWDETAIFCPGDSIWLKVNEVEGDIVWNGEIYIDSFLVTNSQSVLFSVQIENCLFHLEEIEIVYEEDWSIDRIGGPDTVKTELTYVFAVDGNTDWSYEWMGTGFDILSGQGTQEVEVMILEDAPLHIEVAVHIDDLVCKDTIVFKNLELEMSLSSLNSGVQEYILVRYGESAWHIDFGYLGHSRDMILSDTNGRVINAWVDDDETVDVDNTNLPHGLYYLTISGQGDRPITLKLMKW